MNHPVIIAFVLLYIFLWIWSIASVAYVTIFAMASLIKRHLPVSYPKTHIETAPNPSLCFIVPAYAEDGVILDTVKALLAQYGHNHVIVVSDHQSEATEQALASMPITLLKADYTPSSKARALQLACRHLPEYCTHVVVLDADNIVAPLFSAEMYAAISTYPDEVLQCHRCAKNLDTTVARLDAVSEEINNSIFRHGHNALGLSSALIGSGMCFTADWFASHVDRLATSGEDKELEAMLLYEGLHVRYLDKVIVLDHKVQSTQGFSNQRRRWMAAQIVTFFNMIPNLPSALWHGRWAYIDKWLQQALMPRSILMSVLLVFTLLFWRIWWIPLFVLSIAMYAAIPPHMATRQLLRDMFSAPYLALVMLLGIFRLRGQNKAFAHTRHS